MPNDGNGGSDSLPSRNSRLMASSGSSDSERRSPKMIIGPRSSGTTVGETHSRKPVRLCQVCSDIAKSLHFGGLSCDSCKAFFRRSVQNDAYKHFRCGGDQKCSISIASRKFCKYCRFAKCESIGMTKSWVMSEDERLQLMKTRLTKRMMYQNSSSKESSSFSSSVDAADGPQHSQKTPRQSAYHSSMNSVDLGSSGSTPNSSPPTPGSGPTTPVRCNQRVPSTGSHSNNMWNSLSSNNEEPIPAPIINKVVDFPKNNGTMVPKQLSLKTRSYSLSENDSQLLERCMRNIQHVNQVNPYQPNLQSENLMSIYKQFIERMARFLQLFEEFNSLPNKETVLKKNFTVIALIFGSFMMNDVDGSYQNIYSPCRETITSIESIKRTLPPDLFRKFLEVQNALKNIRKDFNIPYLTVLYIVFRHSTMCQSYLNTLKNYMLYLFGDDGIDVCDKYLLIVDNIQSYSEQFEKDRCTVNSDFIDESTKMDATQLKHMFPGLDMDQIKAALNSSDDPPTEDELLKPPLSSTMVLHASPATSNSPHGMLPSASNCQSPHTMMIPSPHSIVYSPHSSLQSPHSMIHSPHNLSQSPMQSSPHVQPQNQYSQHSLLSPSSAVQNQVYLENQTQTYNQSPVNLYSPTPVNSTSSPMSYIASPEAYQEQVKSPNVATFTNSVEPSISLIKENNSQYVDSTCMKNEYNDVTCIKVEDSFYIKDEDSIFSHDLEALDNYNVKISNSPSQFLKTETYTSSSSSLPTRSEDTMSLNSTLNFGVDNLNNDSSSHLFLPSTQPGDLDLQLDNVLYSNSPSTIDDYTAVHSVDSNFDNTLMYMGPFHGNSLGP